MSRSMRSVNAQEIEMEVDVVLCPRCGEEHYSLINYQDDQGWLCHKCKYVLAKSKEGEDIPRKPKNVRGYICPECKIHVSNTPENFTGQKTIDFRNAVLCPNIHEHGHIYLNGLPLIHHGVASSEFQPLVSSTDYVMFQHTKCKDKEHKGLSEAYATLVDKEGRVIANLKCLDCDRIDAIKFLSERFYPYEKTLG